MPFAIRTENLGKQYTLGEMHRDGQLRDAVIRFVSAPFRGWSVRDGAAAGRAPAILRALDGVSVAINHGDVVGIIGRNGSGKSTLLKILARITEPSWGSAEVRGRVGSLLEVGTGFHPDLSGRENVFVNGAILGMRRTEIARKFDEIVAFAEVEPFIDTAVRHYSSGMQVRLAFAVAAHLEPEILLVDEVLAVGDAAFQRRCLGKIDDVAKQGRTVLFVSHDLTAVQVLCRRAIRLVKGRVVGDGEAGDQIQAYLNESKPATRAVLDEPIRLGESLALSRFGFLPTPVTSGETAEFHVEVESSAATRVDELALLVHDALNRRVGVIDFRRVHGHYQVGPGAPLSLTARLRQVPLVEGEYRLGISLRTGDAHHIVYDLATVDVMAQARREMVPYSASIRGVVAFDYAIESAAN